VPPALTPIEQLTAILRPAAGGLYVVSTGVAQQRAVQHRLYGVSTDEDVQRIFTQNLERIAAARAIVLGVPSDVGAGFLRGANLGPQMVRDALLQDATYPRFLADHGIVDIGDVLVCPQLLHDEMLNEAQIRASRRAIYPMLSDAARDELPVSPLSMAERVLDLVFHLNPRVKPFVIGGDHSTAWPAASAIARARKKQDWGIVQPDAHTDLLEERLGVKYCFATWSFHANDLVGRNGRMVQVGTRATRRDRQHWESTLGVRQFWAEDCVRDPARALDDILAHVKSRNLAGVYFSNDIDGTDEAFADATGTPEPGGLQPDFVVELIRRLGREVGLIGGDIMEVAPPIARTIDGSSRTLALAARYARETLAAISP
jgi:arginase family enzyme